MRTSYYGRMRASQFKHLVGQGVAISRGHQYWYGKTYPPLFPTWDMIKMTDEEEYRERYYNEVLSKLDPQKVYKDLGEDAILLCHEKWDDIKQGIAFCHRRMVAEWLEEELGIKVPEVEDEKQKLKEMKKKGFKHPNQIEMELVEIHPVDLKEWEI